MADRDKVINGVEHCFHGQECCGDIECPYYIEHLSDSCCLEECQENLKADVIELLKEQQKQIEQMNFIYGFVYGGQVKEIKELVRCKDCKHGSLYCTEDVCGETLIECNRPDLGDVIEIHRWAWFCADGERNE